MKKNIPYLLLSLLWLSCAPEEKIEYPQVYKFQAVQIDPLRFYQKKADQISLEVVKQPDVGTCNGELKVVLGPAALDTETGACRGFTNWEILGQSTIGRL